MQTLKISYILLKFPNLTETFIAEEIFAIRSHSIEVNIVSLLAPNSEQVQSISQELLQYTWYAPGSISLINWKAHIHFLIKSFKLYFELLFTFLSQPYPTNPLILFLKRLVIFQKAVTTAYFLEGKGIEILHSHFAWLSGGATWICARLLNLPFTVTIHAFDIFSSQNDLLSLVTREATHVISISEYNRSYILALGACKKEDISVVHCGIDLRKFDKQPIFQIEQAPAGPLRILSVGRLIAKKGFGVLIEACRLLKEQGLDFHCTILGGGPDEPALRQQLAACDLQQHVIFLGAKPQPDIIEAYRSNDIFVLACTTALDGDRDGIPVVLMEAGRMGLPLVSTSISGIPELVRHQQTGWLVQPNDPFELANAVKALCSDKALRDRLGENAKALVDSEFNIQNSAKKLSDLFSDICK